MRPAYYFLLLVNLTQSPNGQSFPMPKVPKSQKGLKSAQE